MEGGYFRKKAGFTAVPNSVVNDSTLSLGAIGLYAKIQRLITIPDFTLYKSMLIKKCKEGEKAFDSRWSELKEKGYLKVYRIRSKKRNLFDYEYELLDEADTTKPAVINVRETKSEVYTPHLVGDTKGNGLELEPLQNEGNMNKTLDNKTIGNNNLSINQDDRMKDVREQEACRLTLEANLDYDSFAEMEYLHIGTELLDSWISMMVNTIYSNAESFTINQCKVYQGVLAGMFMKAERHHLLFAIDKYRKVQEKIKNPEAYMRACLWSSIQNQEVVYDHEMVKMGAYKEEI